MLPKNILRFITIVALCTLGFSTAPSGAIPAFAGQEDAALFQEALSAFGQWLNYGQYGSVWRPGQVDKSWRPYTNGRWVPTQEGYVFETNEPWGWATYHYGNWMPTDTHGWVWVPGRTWYPHTVNWRTSDEDVGWAPVPPPENLSQDTYFTDGYAGPGYDASGMNSYGSYPINNSPSDWIFTKAANFLMGWGQPYSSAYSYAGAGLLAAPQYTPTIYERTIYVTNYVSPGYAPNACYNWGPPVTYITRVTNISNVDLDRRCRENRLANLRNVMPPGNLIRRHPAWREILPTAATVGGGQLRSVPNFKLGSGKLNYPDALPAPSSLTPNNKVAGTSSAAAAKQSISASGATTVPTNQNSANLPTGSSQLNKSARQSQVTVPSGSGTVGTASERQNRRELLQKNLPASTATSLEQKTPATQPNQPYQHHRGFQSGESGAHQENQLRRYQEQRRAEQELRMRQQQRLPMQRQQQQETPSYSADQQRLRSQQQLYAEQQRRQAEMQRSQQVQQQRQTEMMRQQQMAQQQHYQQMQQQRQAEMMRRQQMAQQQRHQAEMMRTRQVQQQMVRQAPPSPPASHAQSAQRQKKRDNQQQQ